MILPQKSVVMMEKAQYVILMSLAAMMEHAAYAAGDYGKSNTGPATVAARRRLDTVERPSRHGRYLPVNARLPGLNIAISHIDKWGPSLLAMRL